VVAVVAVLAFIVEIMAHRVMVEQPLVEQQIQAAIMVQLDTGIAAVAALQMEARAAQELAGMGEMVMPPAAVVVAQPSIQAADIHSLNRVVAAAVAHMLSVHSRLRLALQLDQP
jgi:hypothetical protein